MTRSYHGAGLGLFMVRILVELMGGAYGWQPKDLREEIRQELQNVLEL